MSTDSTAKAKEAAQIAALVPPKDPITTEGINIRNLAHDTPEQRVDAIEMIGEETAAGLRPPDHSEVSVGMRYLHCSRTIHQLVTDRNRSVGLYLAVATLLWTASTALLNARVTSEQSFHIIPLQQIQKWCLPLTFAVMTVLALLVAFLLIRTRVGLIYEVAKMNALLGLPVGRVKRVNPLSIFFIMYLIISLAGGTSGGLLSLYLLRLGGMDLSPAVFPAFLIGTAIAAGLVVLYIVSVLQITSDKKLQGDLK